MNCIARIVVAGPLGENRNILHKSDFVGGNGINIKPTCISVESENSDDLVCVRLFLRSAASEPDTTVAEKDTPLHEKVRAACAPLMRRNILHPRVKYSGILYTCG